MTPPHEVIRSLTAPGRRAGLVMDFDGVLAPIVEDPAASRLLDGTADVLAALAGRMELVALVSGRPASFLAERAPVPGVELWGAYGVEHWHDGVVDVLPAVEEWRPVVQGARDRLRDALDGMPGLHLEDKGLAVAVHWRRTPDPVAAGERVTPLVDALCAETGLHAEPGKMVAELRPPVRQDKGTALRRLAERHALDVVAYAGDDRGDLPAFAAVRELGGHPLVVHGPDIAPEVAAIPGTVFESPADFAAWLRELADAGR
jgi:trehalose 6-phosphate phosphatase